MTKGDKRFIRALYKAGLGDLGDSWVVSRLLRIIRELRAERR